MDEGVLVLDRRRPDEVAAAGKEAACRRAADELAAAEGDEIGALGDEALQVRDRRHRSGGVDDHRDIVSVRDLDDVAERQHELGHRAGIEDSRGLVGDRRLKLPAIGADAARHADIAELDEARPRYADGMVEGVPVGAVDDDLALEAGGVGQAVDRRRIVTGHAGRRREREAGCAAGSDAARLPPGHLGDQRGGAPASR
jgi:hypothetical protein